MEQWRSTTLSAFRILSTRQWWLIEADPMPWLCLARKILTSLSSRLSTPKIGQGRTHESCLGLKIWAQISALSQYVFFRFISVSCVHMAPRHLGPTIWKVFLTFRHSRYEHYNILVSTTRSNLFNRFSTSPWMDLAQDELRTRSSLFMPVSKSLLTWRILGNLSQIL